MKDEHDFSGAERGRFYRPGAKLNLPIRLDDEVREFVNRIAESRSADATQVVNDLLRLEMAVGKAVQG